MPQHPLLFLVLGLACILAPAGILSFQTAYDEEHGSPTVVATVGSERAAWRRDSFEVAGGGRMGCVQHRPLRRHDAGGALFVSVGN